MDITRVLLDAGANVKAVCKVMLAIFFPPLSGMQPFKPLFALQAWHDMVAQLQHGTTPLHCAAHLGHVSLVRLFLGVGFDVQATDLVRPSQ